MFKSYIMNDKNNKNFINIIIGFNAEWIKYLFANTLKLKVILKKHKKN